MDVSGWLGWLVVVMMAGWMDGWMDEWSLDRVGGGLSVGWDAARIFTQLLVWRLRAYLWDKFPLQLANWRSLAYPWRVGSGAESKSRTFEVMVFRDATSEFEFGDGCRIVWASRGHCRSWFLSFEKEPFDAIQVPPFQYPPTVRVSPVCRLIGRLPS